MTSRPTAWEKIFESLGFNDDVDMRQLASYIEDLYGKIRDLESRLDQEEQDRRRQHG